MHFKAVQKYPTYIGMITSIMNTVRNFSENKLWQNGTVAIILLVDLYFGSKIIKNYKEMLEQESKKINETFE